MLSSVLVVEDNAEVARLVTRYLAAKNIAHTWSADGPSALAASADRFQAVILDVGLPGMSGLEVAKAIRSRPGGAECVIVGYSGFGRDQDRQAALQAGMDDYFVKTTLIPKVVARIEQLVCERQTHRIAELVAQLHAARELYECELQKARALRERTQAARQAFQRVRISWPTLVLPRIVPARSMQKRSPSPTGPLASLAGAAGHAVRAASHGVHRTA